MKTIESVELRCILPIGHAGKHLHFTRESMPLHQCNRVGEVKIERCAECGTVGEHDCPADICRWDD